MTTRATVIAHSISPAGKEIITWECIYPWQIHGEVMTHRVFSRNASSNRAIPVAKMLEEVRDPARRAYPSFAATAGAGMQGGPPPTEQQLQHFRDLWDMAATDAANNAAMLVRHGAAKQDANRLLMPFTHAHTLITTTEYDNFFGLRLDKMADPTMRALAVAMWEAKLKSVPVRLEIADWHLPFIDDADYDNFDDCDKDTKLMFLIKMSVARCARVSYQEVETQKRSTIAADLKLYDRLLAGATKHASPAEHQASPDACVNGVWANPDQWGNFKEWRQYRKLLPGEAVASLPAEYQL